MEFELDSTFALLEEAGVALELEETTTSLDELEAITELELEAACSLLEEDSSALDEDKSTDSATKDAVTSTSKFGMSKAQLPSTALPPIPHMPGICEPGST